MDLKNYEWKPQPCPRCRTVNCLWIDDRIGYRCPQCALFVAQPRRHIQPAPAPEDLDEQLSNALSETSLDEEEVREAVAAVMTALRDHRAPVEAADTSSADENREVRAVDLSQPHSGRLWTVSRVGKKAQWGDGLYLTEGEAQAALDADRAARTSKEAGQ